MPTSSTPTISTPTSGSNCNSRLRSSNESCGACIGAHTLINSQETFLVIGLTAAKQLGADYPFNDPAARRAFNYYGSILYGWRFRKVKH